MRPEYETDAAFQRAAFVARESYGRLVAYLATRWGDLAAAEDALGAAFVAALERWPTAGVPARPESWLLTVARRKLIDSARHNAILRRPAIVAALNDALTMHRAPAAALPDARIRLMLVCAHPAIDPKIRPALMLQAVLGLEAKTMASAFLVSAATMTKRLVRAKAKIRAAGLRFEEPTAADMQPRLHTLLEAIYAAYFLGREGAVADGDGHDQLRDEAVYLARTVANALPLAAEALGFLALLTFCEARRAAQVNAAGAFVPLLEQDAGRWDRALMREGLSAAGAGRRAGRDRAIPARSRHSSGPLLPGTCREVSPGTRSNGCTRPWSPTIPQWAAWSAMPWRRPMPSTTRPTA